MPKNRWWSRRKPPALLDTGHGEYRASKRLLLGFAGVHGNKSGHRATRDRPPSTVITFGSLRKLWAPAAMREKKKEVARIQLEELVAEFSEIHSLQGSSTYLHRGCPNECLRVESVLVRGAHDVGVFPIDLFWINGSLSLIRSNYSVDLEEIHYER
jgi:hypothetical protein